MNGNREFVTAIAAALRRGYGGDSSAVKRVVAQTGANERAVRNWFEGKNGPSGEYLVELTRHSDEVLVSVLQMAGRSEILKAKILVDARAKLGEMLAMIDQLQSPEL